MHANLDADEVVQQLYAAHWRQLVRLSVLLVHDAGSAEEIVQDAFVAMHSRWSRLCDPEKALAYLRQAVVSRSRSALRHRKVVERHLTARAGWRRSPGRGRTRPRRTPRGAPRYSTECGGSPSGSARCSRCATSSSSPRPRSRKHSEQYRRGDEP